MVFDPRTTNPLRFLWFLISWRQILDDSTGFRRFLISTRILRFQVHLLLNTMYGVNLEYMVNYKALLVEHDVRRQFEDALHVDHADLRHSELSAFRCVFVLHPFPLLPKTHAPNP